jgi:chromosome partitioning protein
VIHFTDSYQIDVISNDAIFTDQFMNKASKMTAVSFQNHDLIELTLKEVEDDYDVCIMDCSPGRFMLHDNIFQAADLLLIPNVPAPLSVYCNNMLMDALQHESWFSKKVLSFYNMVQIHKNLHKQYLDNRKSDPRVLNHYIPFYTEIELITLTKESIFHQLKEFKATIYYQRLWMEVCERMQWQALNHSKGIVVDIQKEQTSETPSILPGISDEPAKTSNG